MAKILIAEDDKALSGVLQKKLELNGYEAAVAADGEETLKALKSGKYDMVLFDIVMPKVNCYEVLEKMHGDPELSSIPVIVISNSGQPVELEKVKSLGAVDYLVKANFEPNEVLEKINQYLSSLNKPSITTSISDNKEVNTGAYSVLIIEDDKFLRDLLSLKLKKEGFKVDEAIDGEEGLAKVRSVKPSIIILDLIIPGKDGFALLQDLKKDPNTEAIPVIVLSNLGQREDIERAKSLGAKDYMIKAQLTPIEVVERIKSVLRKSYI
ncbi:MAG: response regulator [Patescibacteria group bacterium]